MNLSVCCLTGMPGPQVAAALAPLRDVADEIILAADARVDADTMEWYVGLADRVLPVEYQTPPERYMMWLHQMCAGSWILRIDGDEVVSQALLDALPELARRRDVLQFRVPRRWLFPDRNHWLDEWPWTPDYQTRLVRRVPSMWFPGLLHSQPPAVFPSEYLEAPIYHLDAVLTDRIVRQQKVAEHLSLPVEHVIAASRKLISTFYLPEEKATLDPVPVPEADRARIAASFERGPPRITPDPLITRAEIDRTWAARPFALEACRAAIAPVDVHRRLVAAEHRPFRVLVTNIGQEWWPGGEREPLIRVSYRWKNGSGAIVVPEGFRTAFPTPVNAGEACLVPAVVAAPDVPGDYILEFRVVHEHVRWFDASLSLAIQVVKP